MSFVFIVDHLTCRRRHLSYHQWPSLKVFYETCYLNSVIDWIVETRQKFPQSMITNK